MEGIATSHGLRRHWFLIIGLCVGIVLAIIGVWFLFGTKTSGVPPEMYTVRQSTPYTLYYPQPLPSGFAAVSGSFKQAGSTTMFNITDSQNRTIIVTEQSKPSIIEELKKVKEFSTSIGNAYIADLNGRAVGVIITDSTLIIASGSADGTSGNQLQQLLVSFKVL